MSPAGGRGYDGPDIEEVLASIRRLIRTSDSSSPSSFAPVDHQPPLAELYPSDLSASSRSAHASARPGLSPFPPIGVAREVESERPQPRVMAPCKDTLIARMGQRTFDTPRALSFENKDGPPDEGGFCPMPLLPIVGPVRGHEIPRARFGRENFLLGRGAADDADDMNEINPPAERGSASPQSFNVDQTAALLRPILRQWVDDNMKQVFMEALRDAVTTTPDPKK
jgi:hypothetical protein